MKKIGFVIADDCEFAPVEAYALSHGGRTEQKYGDKLAFFPEGDAEIIAVWCGIGKVNAAGAAAALCIGERVDAMLNFGLSGGISGVRRGDIVIGTRFWEHDFDLTALGYEAGVKPQPESSYAPDAALYDALTAACPAAKPCVFVTGDVFVSSKEAKAFAVRRFGAGCCDMETAAIASVCHKNGVPFASLRSISDDADESASGDYREENDKCEDTLLQIALRVAGRYTASVF